MSAEPQIANPAARWTDWTLTAAVLLACAVALSKNHADPDLWGHVQYGRDALRHGLPAAATYSYTAEGRPWINHEVLSEVLLALGADTLGGAGLLLIKCLLGLAVTAAIMRRARSAGAGQTVAALVVLLTAANLMLFWSMRPQLASFVLFTALVLLLDAAAPEASDGPACRGRPARLWLAVPLMAVWANAHGAFAAGLAVAAAYVGGRWLEAWRRGGRAAAGPFAAGAAPPLTAAVLATFCNPYGWRLHLWLWDALSKPRPEIVEWLPPWPNQLVWLPFWLTLVLLAAGLLLGRRPKDWTQLAVLGLVFWQAAAHRRHIPFAAILFGLWAPAHVQGLWDRLVGECSAAGLSGKTNRWLGAAAAAACVVLSLVLGGQLRQLVVRRDVYPVAAIQYMAQQRLQGRLLATFRWAQYAIAACGARTANEPGVRLAFDGRFRTCYPQYVVDWYFDFAAGDRAAKRRWRSPSSPPIRPARILDAAPPDLVLIDRSHQTPARVMAERADEWVLLYQDGLAQLWGRAAKYADPRSADYVPPQRRRVSDQPQEGVALWPAVPQAGRRPAQLAAR